MISFVILLILSSSATSQWTKPTNQYPNQPAQAFSPSAGNTWPGNAGTTSPQYSSLSPAPGAPAYQTYKTQGSNTGSYTTGEPYQSITTSTASSETTETPYSTTSSETTDKPYSTTTESFQEGATTEDPKKIVEATLVESGPNERETNSGNQADIPGSESKTAFPGKYLRLVRFSLFLIGLHLK